MMRGVPTAGVVGGRPFGRIADATDETRQQMRRDGWDTCEHDNVRRWCPQCCPETGREARTFPTVRGLENALKLWRGGFDSWRNVPRVEHRAEHESVIRAIKEHLNNCPTVAVLVSRYYEPNDWCIEIARRVHPDKPYCQRLSIVEDAAYWLRLLELGDTCR